MEKKLTPIQQAVELLQKEMHTSKHLTETQFFHNDSIEACIEHVKSLLPVEKEFAKDMWDSGTKFSLEQMDNAVKKYKEPDFTTFYKQFEP